ncbi:MAG: CopG family transcriptional regulator [Verrucomicrobiota bacterium]
MRTIIDLPADQVEALAKHCANRGISRAEAVRNAVSRLLSEDQEQTLDQAFGAWADQPFDAVEYVREMRKEWDS